MYGKLTIGHNSLVFSFNTFIKRSVGVVGIDDDVELFDVEGGIISFVLLVLLLLLLITNWEFFDWVVIMVGDESILDVIICSDLNLYFWDGLSLLKFEVLLIISFSCSLDWFVINNLLKNLATYILKIEQYNNYLYMKQIYQNKVEQLES